MGHYESSYEQEEADTRWENLLAIQEIHVRIEDALCLAKQLQNRLNKGDLYGNSLVASLIAAEGIVNTLLKHFED